MVLVGTSVAFTLYAPENTRVEYAVSTTIKELSAAEDGKEFFRKSGVGTVIEVPEEVVLFETTIMFFKLTESLENFLS